MTFVRRHPAVTLAVFTAAMMVAIAAAGEYMMRRLGYLPATRYYQLTDTLRVDDSFRTDEHGIFKANPAFWKNVPGTSINSDGFRSPEFSGPPKGDPSVLIIGDSYAYGIGADPYSNAFPDLIRAHGYTVYNTGIPGVGPRQYELIADQYVPRLKPDVTIVSFFVGNDLQVTLDPATPHRNLLWVTNAGWIQGFDDCGRPLAAQEAYDYYIGRTQPPAGNLLLSTSIGTALWNLVGKPAAGEQVKSSRPPCPVPAAPQSAEPFAATFGALRHIRDVASANHARFFVLVIPTRGAGCTPAWRDITRIRPQFDALNPIYLEDIPENVYLPAPSCHVNNQGHRFVADRILSVLK